MNGYMYTYDVAQQSSNAPPVYHSQVSLCKYLNRICISWMKKRCVQHWQVILFEKLGLASYFFKQSLLKYSQRVHFC